MKYIKEYKTFITPEEETINRILDKGIENATDDELEILKNNGKMNKKTLFSDNKFNFELESVEDFGDEIKVKGNLTYHDEEYYGWFTIPKNDKQGANSWDFFQDRMKFDPDPDDLYDLDSFIQEIEYEYVN